MYTPIDRLAHGQSGAGIAWQACHTMEARGDIRSAERLPANP